MFIDSINILTFNFSSHKFFFEIIIPSSFMLLVIVLVTILIKDDVT